MNITNNNDNDYYEKLVLEIGFLQEDIKLPKLPDSELTFDYLKNHGSYPLMQNCYKDMIGKFYIPVLFPLVDKSDGPEEFEYSMPKTIKTNNTIIPVKYSSVNYIELVIPKYIVMQFRDKIPKDTMFLIGFSGEHKKISNLNVIGLYGAGIDITLEENEDGRSTIND